MELQLASTLNLFLAVLHGMNYATVTFENDFVIDLISEMLELRSTCTETRWWIFFSSWTLTKLKEAPACANCVVIAVFIVIIIGKKSKDLNNRKKYTVIMFLCLLLMKVAQCYLKNYRVTHLLTFSNIISHSSRLIAPLTFVSVFRTGCKLSPSCWHLL